MENSWFWWFCKGGFKFLVEILRGDHGPLFRSRGAIKWFLDYFTTPKSLLKQQVILSAAAYMFVNLTIAHSKTCLERTNIHLGIWRKKCDHAFDHKFFLTSRPRRTPKCNKLLTKALRERVQKSAHKVALMTSIIVTRNAGPQTSTRKLDARCRRGNFLPKMEVIRRWM